MHHRRGGQGVHLSRSCILAFKTGDIFISLSTSGVTYAKSGSSQSVTFLLKREEQALRQNSSGFMFSIHERGHHALGAHRGNTTGSTAGPCTSGIPSSRIALKASVISKKWSKACSSLSRFASVHCRRCQAQAVAPQDGK